MSLKQMIFFPIASDIVDVVDACWLSVELISWIFSGFYQHRTSESSAPNNHPTFILPTVRWLKKKKKLIRFYSVIALHRMDSASIELETCMKELSHLSVLPRTTWTENWIGRNLFGWVVVWPHLLRFIPLLIIRITSHEHIMKFSSLKLFRFRCKCLCRRKTGECDAFTNRFYWNNGTVKLENVTVFSYSAQFVYCLLWSGELVWNAYVLLCAVFILHSNYFIDVLASFLSFCGNLSARDLASFFAYMAIEQNWNRLFHTSGF